MTNFVPSIHESINARSLSVPELCRTFIVNEYFQQLASSNNTIMIGPRGSGKTTLMRMLEVEALEVWQGEVANKFRDEISFSGVFIPTDRFWKVQYDQAKKVLGGDARSEELLKATFIYHTLEKLASAVEYRASRVEKKENKFRVVDLRKSDEVELVKELSDYWKVSPKISSLKSLEVAVTGKKSEVSNYISSLLNGDDELPRPDVVRGTVSQILGDSVRIVNTYLSERGEKWTFLFDELELAPEDLVQPLVDSMRGGPEGVIFKLSLSPYHRGVSITEYPESSMRDQDLSFINLTGSTDAAGLEFSEKLCGNIFRRHGFSAPVTSYFEEVEFSSEEKDFRELSDKDSTFKDYLQGQGIDPEKLKNYKEKDRRPTIRKIKFVAQLRNYYRKKGGKQGRKRPADIYGGFSNICKAMEFNPRMLIGIMNKLIKRVSAGEQIPMHAQIECIEEIYNSYKALLSTISIDSKYQGIDTIYDLVEVVATKFQEQVVGDTFYPEPKGTLTFAKVSDPHLTEAVGLALNAGALIVDKGFRGTFHDIVDVKKSRCRLSFLFSHHFILLMTVQRPIDLSELLAGRVGNKKGPHNGRETQIDLI